MKTDKLATGSLILFGMLFVGTMAYAGFSELFSPSSISQLQQSPLSLQVNVMRQLTGTSCGEAVITMVYNHVHPEAPILEQEVIDYAITQGYYTEDLPPFTSPSDMVKIAKYYADDVSTGAVFGPDQGLALLIQKLKNGEPVIIDVLSNFSDPQSEAHFVVVTGVSIDPNRAMRLSSAITIRSLVETNRQTGLAIKGSGTPGKTTVTLAVQAGGW